jgi:hypothetical protein
MQNLHNQSGLSMGCIFFFLVVSGKERKKRMLPFNVMMAVNGVCDIFPVLKHRTCGSVSDFAITGKSYSLSRSMGGLL